VISERPNHQFLQVVTTPIAGGGEWAALAVFHDVTDVKRTEQVRRDFVANVSHELRTPLAAIKSLIESLESGALDEPETAKDFLERANHEVDRLVRLVEELLELSRIESGEVPMATEPVQIGDVLARAVARLRHQAQRQGLELTLEAAPGLPAILGDAERLERVAVNLIHNALKFTPAGGSVRVRAAREGGAVVVKVSDSGAGIAAEDLPRIFERFYKADRARSGAGTGLGLAIVKHTVEAHGGAVSVESVEGRGATFSLSLPAAPTPARA
jgi:two-component system phosphate regulon sensor histidine kinase PhoR